MILSSGQKADPLNTPAQTTGTEKGAEEKRLVGSRSGPLSAKEKADKAKSISRRYFNPVAPEHSDRHKVSVEADKISPHPSILLGISCSEKVYDPCSDKDFVINVSAMLRARTSITFLTIGTIFRGLYFVRPEALIFRDLETGNEHELNIFRGERGESYDIVEPH